MFFLKRYRNCIGEIPELIINNIKYGVHLRISFNNDKITIYHQYGKSQSLLCRLARSKRNILRYPLCIDYNNLTTYAEYRNESYHGCYAEYNGYGVCSKYVSYNNGILHGKSVKVEHNDTYYVYITSIKYINGYADKVKLLHYSTNRERINIRYYDIPFTYLCIDDFHNDEIKTKIANVSYYYTVNDNITSYEKYINGVLKCIYKWDDYKVIYKTEHHGNIEIEYNITDVERLSVLIHHKIERFSITRTNRLVEYKWQIENNSIKFININLYKAPSLKEYKVIKYDDGKYRKNALNIGEFIKY